MPLDSFFTLNPGKIYRLVPTHHQLIVLFQLIHLQGRKLAESRYPI